jgi:hypothetical protein
MFEVGEREVDFCSTLENECLIFFCLLSSRSSNSVNYTRCIKVRFGAVTFGKRVSFVHVHNLSYEAQIREGV